MTDSVKETKYDLPNGGSVTYRYGLRRIGSQPPYFFLNYEERDVYGKEVGGGCASHQDLGHDPVLQLFQSLHLSDEDGIPVHCFANGWYWLGYTEHQPFNSSLVAEHFRISVGEAVALRAKLDKAISGYSVRKTGLEYARPVLKRWIAEQKLIWKEQAEKAKSLLELD